MIVTQQGESRSLQITLPAARSTYAQVFVYLRQAEEIVYAAELVPELSLAVLRAHPSILTDVYLDLTVAQLAAIPTGRDTELEVWTRAVSAPLGVAGLVLAQLTAKYLRVDAHPLFNGVTAEYPNAVPYLTKAEADELYDPIGLIIALS
jgi:hypothetical protein